MKLQFWTILVCVAILASCNKENVTDMNPAASEAGYLLSGVITGADTLLHAEYNNKNQLIKFVSGFTVCDSIAYNSNAQLISCRYTINNAIRMVFHTSFSYENDAIKRITTDSVNSWYSTIKLFKLVNNKIVTSTNGYIYNGASSFNMDTISYMYSDNNLVKSIRPYPVPNYQPVDTFAHHNQVYNPYQTFGNHVWALLTDDMITTGSGSILLAETRNLPSVESYAYYSVSNTTLVSSGITNYKTTVMNTSAENILLPKLVKRIDDNGIETMIQFIYIKKK